MTAATSVRGRALRPIQEKGTVKRSHSPEGKPTLNTEPDRKAPRTPPKSRPSRRQSENARIVTPSTSVESYEKAKEREVHVVTTNARRSLVMPSGPTVPEEQIENKENVGRFGRNTKCIEVPRNVKTVYHIVNKHTGTVGGNGHGGAIYGELTAGSMQKMTNLMIQHTNFGPESRFIDVGCGLAKPNLHVASFPGVEFSYGIEMEQVRWMLGMANLHQVLQVAKKDSETEIGHRCFLAHGDITEASYFDPFTHVYMFDIGFPPRLFRQLSEMFNTSHSEYLICYHGPKLMIDRYEFNVELITQTPTSMHGSSEVHTGYLYRRVGAPDKSKTCSNKIYGVPCDPLFAKAWELCNAGVDDLSDYVADKVMQHLGATNKRFTRSAARKINVVED